MSKLYCSAASRAGRSQAAKGIPLTPPANGANGSRLGSLTISQEFLRIFDQGVARAFPPSLYTRYSLLFDTMLELESQGHQAIAALGAVIHLSEFRSQGARLRPHEIVNELFSPRNYQEYQSVLQRLAGEDFKVPTAAGQDPYRQVLANYQELAVAATKIQWQPRISFCFIIIF